MNTQTERAVQALREAKLKMTVAEETAAHIERELFAAQNERAEARQRYQGLLNSFGHNL